MWLTLAKWALLAFIAIGVTIFVVAYLRNVRKFKTQRYRSNPNLGPSTTWAVVPPTPLPEWVDWDDDEPEDDPTRRRSR
ncbi:hypothetical protein [Mycolicibacterium smegmatis]|uniref:Uncharacterized protein n=1 Tax=Mycolicibacterium smegmatis (strain MKD8) TaxID=1214915 RepID=A0A2U9PRA7_MYCSE|nr:hypothetical protein [Mycolicibacterium smegmatis]AWT54331.1 hypothetical protein D806_033590 [Mycolicibacterium smegmatis MKD8]